MPFPSTSWFQANGFLFLSIFLEDCHDYVIEMEPNKVYFKGAGHKWKNKMDFEVTIDLFGEIDDKVRSTIFRQVIYAILTNN